MGDITSEGPAGGITFSYAPTYLPRINLNFLVSFPDTSQSLLGVRMSLSIQIRINFIDSYRILICTNDFYIQFILDAVGGETG